MSKWYSGLTKIFTLSLDMADFRKFFAKAKHIVVISGAGISAESGVPTFRGAGGYWRKWKAQVSNVSRTFRGSSELSHSRVCLRTSADAWNPEGKVLKFTMTLLFILATTQSL